MKLGFRKQFVIPILFAIGLLFANLVSMSSCSLNIVSLPEIAANDIKLMKKEDNGYVRVDFVSKDNNYLAASRENVYSISSFRNSDSSFATYQEDSLFDYSLENYTFQIPTIGLTNQKNSFVPLQMKELEFSKGNYLNAKDLFIGKNGCLLSEQIAQNMASRLNVSISELIGREIVASNHELTFSIISIVEDSSFASLCFPDTFQNGFLAVDFSALARIKKCTFHLFLSNEYNQNFSIFYKAFSTIYHLNSFPYVEMVSPKNAWFAQEINSFILGNTKTVGNIILIFSEFIFIATSIIGSLIFFKKINFNANISSIYLILFITLFLLISIASSLLISRLTLFGFHVNAQSSTSYTIALINAVIVIACFVTTRNAFSKKNSAIEKDYYELEI